MDLLGDYFSDYFDEAVTPVAAASSSVSIFDTAQVRYLVFRIGQLRFALRRSDIVSVSSAPDFGCHFLDPRVMVPTRYADAAAASGEQSSYVQLPGLPYGFGPCRIDEDITLPRDALNARATNRTEPWIIGTLTDPPSLVLDRQLLGAHLMLSAHA